MAVINANLMSLYMLETDSSTAVVVITAATLAAAVPPAGMVDDDYCIVVTSAGVFVGFGKKSGSSIVTAASELVLFAAATQSTIEASSSTAETVARNGLGGSESYVVSGASAWTVSAEGLLDLANSTGTGKKVLDAALAKSYVMVKFDTGGGVFYVGQGIIENAQISGGVDDMATYSASIKGYGTLYPNV